MKKEFRTREWIFHQVYRCFYILFNHVICASSFEVNLIDVVFILYAMAVHIFIDYYFQCHDFKTSFSASKTSFYNQHILTQKLVSHFSASIKKLVSNLGNQIPDTKN